MVELCHAQWGYIFQCAGRAQTSSGGSVSVSPAGGNSDRNLGITDVHAAKRETSQVKSTLLNLSQGLGFYFPEGMMTSKDFLVL